MRGILTEDILTRSPGERNKFVESTIVVLTGVPADYSDRLAEVLCKAGGKPVGEAMEQWLDDALLSQGLAKQGLISRNPEPVGPELVQRARQLCQEWQDQGGIVVCHAPRMTLFLRQWVQWLSRARFLLTYRTPWVTLDNLYGDHSRRGGESATEPFAHDPRRAVRVVEHYHRELLNFGREFRDQTAAVNLDGFERQPALVVDALLGDRRFIPVASPTPVTVLPGNDDRTWRDRAHLLRQNHSSLVALYEELNTLALAPQAIAPAPEPFSESSPAPVDQPLRDWANSARSRGLAARSDLQLTEQIEELRSLRKRVKTLELALDQAQFQRHQAQVHGGQFQIRIEQLEPALDHLKEQLEQLQVRYDQRGALLGAQHTQVEYLTEERDGLRQRLQERAIAEQDLRVDCQQAVAALKRETERYERAKNALATSQSQFNEVQVRLQQAQDALVAMQTSKFWKLRNRWFKFKGKLAEDGIAQNRHLFASIVAALELAPVPPLPMDVGVDLEAERDAIRSSMEQHFPEVDPRHTRVAIALFDREHYLATYPDLAESMGKMRYVDLFSHFLQCGAVEKRDPSPLFDTAYYAKHNPKVTQAIEGGKYHSYFDHFIQVGMAAGLNPSARFDNDFYLAEYADVAGLVDLGHVSSGFEHYLLAGGREGRLPLPLPDLEEQGLTEMGDRRGMVAFISGCAGAPYRYRCEHQAAILESLGYTVELFEVGQYPHEELLERFQAIVMHRVGYHRGLDAMVATARERGIRVVFETDDWVFEPEMLHQIEDARTSDEETQVFYDRMVRQFQRSIAMCDGVTVSTPRLKEAVLAQHPDAKVAVLPNRISPEMEKLAIAALETPRPAEDASKVRLGYFSGTRTHQGDFDQCVGALETVLDNCPQACLRVVGHLTVPEELREKFGDRIETVPIVPWQKLPQLYRTTDINLAPLNPDVPFNEGKSELKFVEAGLMGVPTVASQRGPYAMAIETGVTGWLCETEADWVKGLTRLIEDPGLRQQLGEAAQQRVRDRYLTRTALMESWQAWQSVLLGESSETNQAHRSWSIAVVVWGDRTLTHNLHQWSSWDEGIVALTQGLSDRGHDVTVYLQGDAGLSHDDLRERKRVWDDKLAGTVAAVDYFEFQRQWPVVCDVAIATNWQTAYAVANLERVRLRMHWMVENPAATVALGDPQGDARGGSLFLPLRPVTVGLELRDRLLQTPGFRNAVEWVPVPLGSVFIETDAQPERHLRPDTTVQLLWYDDPATDPTVRTWVMETLEMLTEEYGEGLLVRCYGQDSSLDGEKRAQWFSAATIYGAIAQSPLESMVEAIACGCVGMVLGDGDLTGEGRALEDYVVRSPLNPDSFANHLRQLINDGQRRCHLAAAGAKWAKQLTWEKTAEAMAEVLDRATFSGSAPAALPAPSPASLTQEMEGHCD